MKANKNMTGYPSIDRPWLKYFPEDAVEYVTKHLEQSAYQNIKEVNKSRQHYIALEYFGVQITYGELFDKIEGVAKALKASGIPEGDFVSICLPNVPQIVYFIYALNRIGATACLIDPRTNAEGILDKVNDSNSKLLVTVEDIIEEKINLIADRLIAKIIVNVSPADSASITVLKSIPLKMVYTIKRIQAKSHKYIKYRDYIKKGAKWTGSIDSNSSTDTPAIIVYTSGTTGSSKGVVLSNQNMISSQKMQSYGSAEVGENSSFLAVIPFFASYGAFNGMNYSLSHGWKIILIPKYKLNKFDHLILKYKAVSALGVPRFWSDFAEAGIDTDLSFLKNPVCGGDKISPASVNKINKYFISHSAHQLKMGYGASEFGGAIVVATDVGPYEEGATGEILPGVIGMVINPDTGEEMKYGEDGELCFYSPTMMMGYLHCEDETAQITMYKDGIKYYRTGDKGHINENGSVFIVDRYKRVMMLPDGHTVHAAPIENLIMEHDSVEVCSVVGLPLNESGGVIPTAFIKLKDKDMEADQGKIIDEIDTLCLQKIPERDKAHAYVIVDSLPYTFMGKVDYRALGKYRFSELEHIVKDHSFLK